MSSVEFAVWRPTTNIWSTLHFSKVFFFQLQLNLRDSLIGPVSYLPDFTVYYDITAKQQAFCVIGAAAGIISASGSHEVWTFLDPNKPSRSFCLLTPQLVLISSTLCATTPPILLDEENSAADFACETAHV